MAGEADIVRFCGQGDDVIQTKGMRTYASGIRWEPQLQEKAGFTFPAGVELVKAAMASHIDNVEVQTVALDSLIKYSSRPHRADDFKKNGGEGLLKAVLTRHWDVKELQAKGRVVLGGLSVDPKWQPRNT